MRKYSKILFGRKFYEFVLYYILHLLPLNTPFVKYYKNSKTAALKIKLKQQNCERHGKVPNEKGNTFKAIEKLLSSITPKANDLGKNLSPNLK